MPESIGFIGLGIMGRAMATRLLDTGGHNVLVNNRTPDKASTLIDAGARWFDTPSQAAASADVVITFVTDATALEAVAFSPQGILAGIGPNAVHCDMSTIAPSAAVHAHTRYKDAGRRYVQAPVLGSWKQILDGSLLVFGGGDTVDVDYCQAAWDSFAREVWRFDTVEQSAAAKIACNALIGQMIVGLGQTLALAGESGIPPATMLDIIAKSNLASPMYASKGKTIADGNYTPNFIVRNMLKDLRLASDYAAEKDLVLPANAANRELFVRAIADGLGDEDYSAVVKTMIRTHQ